MVGDIFVDIFFQLLYDGQKVQAGGKDASEI
jgi:hypothetical protein